MEIKIKDIFESVQELDNFYNRHTSEIEFALTQYLTKGFDYANRYLNSIFKDKDKHKKSWFFILEVLREDEEEFKEESIKKIESVLK